MYAALHADVRMMQLLLANKADVNHRNAVGATALMWAAGDLAKVRVLVQAGANVNAISDAGRTPLIVAANYSGNLETVRFLIANGADPKQVDRTGDGPVGSAATAGDVTVLRELLSKGANAREFVRTGGGNFRGYTPLMRAAQAGCVECVRVLIAAGADVDRISDNPAAIQSGLQGLGNLTALLLAAPKGNTELVRVLLEKGASVEMRDARGMTPLMLATTNEDQNADIVRLLLARGAKADIRAADGQSALGWAQKWGSNTEVSRLLIEHGAKPDGLEQQVTPAPASSQRTAREAVHGAIVLMQQSNTIYFKKAGCYGCHHQLLSSLVIGAAGKRGIFADQALASEQVKTLVNIKNRLREPLMQRVSTGVSPIENALVLLALSAQEYSPDALTDALWHDVAGLQRMDGSWLALNQRPPIVYSSFSATAYAIGALQLYASPGRKPEMERRIARARQWLLSVKPQHTEERAMQLLGLHWSGLDRNRLLPNAKALIQLQKPNGEWSQRDGLQPDAYATGQALYALATAGALSTTDPIFRRGVEYLIKTQHDDGSWYVRSRSVKFQPYFESGFPYGHDQWISAAGTNWAALALTFAADGIPASAN
jgi:ankyrin repeat protein